MVRLYDKQTSKYQKVYRYPLVFMQSNIDWDFNY